MCRLSQRDRTWFVSNGSPRGRKRREERSGKVGMRAREEAALQEELDAQVLDAMVAEEEGLSDERSARRGGGRSSRGLSEGLLLM